MSYSGSVLLILLMGSINVCSRIEWTGPLAHLFPFSVTILNGLLRPILTVYFSMKYWKNWWINFFDQRVSCKALFTSPNTQQAWFACHNKVDENFLVAININQHQPTTLHCPWIRFKPSLVTFLKKTSDWLDLFELLSDKKPAFSFCYGTLIKNRP